MKESSNHASQVLTVKQCTILNGQQILILLRDNKPVCFRKARSHFWESIEEENWSLAMVINRL